MYVNRFSSVTPKCDVDGYIVFRMDKCIRNSNAWLMCAALYKTTESKSALLKLFQCEKHVQSPNS